eukprot:snap_masked-scaffold_2-processed-gene-4.15-mRNA-1 protein AED:1.00 eAED:1.00 QI:0/0/0/0/1/1/2/0/64
MKTYHIRGLTPTTFLCVNPILQNSRLSVSSQECIFHVPKIPFEFITTPGKRPQTLPLVASTTQL